MRRGSVPEPGSADLLVPIPILFCVLRTPDVQARGSSVVTVGQHSMVMRPVRLKGISHTTPIGWPARIGEKSPLHQLRPFWPSAINPPHVQSTVRFGPLETIKEHCMGELVAGGGFLFVALWTIGTELFLLWLAYRFVRAFEIFVREMIMKERANRE
jgi:hypothetical protein